MASNATPCEKLSKELRFDTNIIGLRQTLKCLDAKRLYQKDTLVDIWESQIETCEVTEIKAINIEGKVQRN